MNSHAALSLAQTPPLAVPLRFLLTGPAFAAMAGIAVLVLGPEAFASRWSAPVLALTHLLTLGALGSVMVGALFQLLPVLAGSPVPWQRPASVVVHALLALGTLALVTGLGWGWAPAAWTGVAALAVALGGFTLLGAIALVRTRSRHPTACAMRLALVGLAVTVLLGVYLGSGHADPDRAPARQWTDLHLLWGLVGWIGALLMGVAYQVVPMFQITPQYPQWMQRLWVPALAVLLALGSGLYARAHAVPVWLWAAGGTLLALFALTTLWLQWRRRRRLKDVTVRYWQLGMAALLLSLALVPVPGAGFGAGVIFLAGFTWSVIAGMLYKIVPFLVWLHLTNRLQSVQAWSVTVPNMKQVIPARQQWWQWYTHLVATVALAAGLLWPQLFARPAGALFALAALGLLWNLSGAVRVYRRTRAAIDAAAP